MKISLLLSIILLSLSSPSLAGLYRWIDANGNVSYSDKIPPTAAKLGHIELNYSGIRKKKELSAKQRKALEDIKIQKNKERKEKKEQSIKAALKKMQDEQLLSIYSNRKELINVYEGKINMSSMSIALLKKRHKILSERLAKTEIKHEKMKNPKFKETLAEKIDDMLDGLKVYQQAITENMVEKNKLEKQYAINLKRFDDLSEKDQTSDKKENSILNDFEKLKKIILAQKKAKTLKAKKEKAVDATN